MGTTKRPVLPSADSTVVFVSLVGGFELLMIVLYSIGADYGNTGTPSAAAAAASDIAASYAFYQDVNAMIYLGEQCPTAGAPSRGCSRARAQRERWQACLVRQPSRAPPAFRSRGRGPTHR